MTHKFSQYVPEDLKDEWPYNGLTLKQEIFATALTLYDNGSKAFRLAYNSKAKPNAVAVAASKLKRNPKIQKRLHSILANGPMKVSLEHHLKKLEELRDMAADDGKYSAAIQAEFLRGKASGLYVEKIEHKKPEQENPEELSLEELDARIASITSGTSADVADASGEEETFAIEDQSGGFYGLPDGDVAREASPSYLRQTSEGGIEED